jgi:hypothetical protein
MAPAPAIAVHGTAVVIGEAGVLIRGASGAGKSALALALVEEGRRSGAFARLVGDDRVLLSAMHARVLMRPHPRIAGQVERRGQGVGPAAHETAVVLHCVVDIAPAGAPPPRAPDACDRRVTIEGVDLPRLSLISGRPAENARLVLDFLARLAGRS